MTLGELKMSPDFFLNKIFKDGSKGFYTLNITEITLPFSVEVSGMIYSVRQRLFN